MKDEFAINKIFCCSGFQHRVGDAGQRGMAVLVVKTSEGLDFRLQSRGIAFEDVAKVHPVPDYPVINVSCETGLRYCPFCGTRLHKLLKKSQQAFEELAAKHRKFYDGP